MDLLNLFVRLTVDDQASGKMDGLSSTMIAKGQLIASAIQSAVSAAINAIKGLITSSIEAFSKYEQLTGGIETFFGSAAGKVMDNAKNAFRTAGMSANQYMETVSSFATTLVNSVAQRGKETVQTSTQDAQQASKEYSRMLSDQIDELKYAQQDIVYERQQANQQELDDVRESQEQEVREFQRATDAKIAEINREYDEKIRAIDEAEKRQLESIQGQIDAIESQGKAEDKAAKERERQSKLNELREKEASAYTVEEQEKIRKEISDLQRRYAEQDADEARRERISRLKEEQQDVKDAASEKRETIKEQQQQEITDYKNARAEELQALRDSHAQQIREIQNLHAQELRELQRAQAEELKAAQRHNEDLIAERKRASEQLAGSSREFVEATEADKQKAAELADRAIIDMADNANKMGTSMDMIQNAYQGFAKDNFTMLDNLKLGFGGTKEEMERLLETAEQIQAKNGEVTEYSIDNFADIVEAIHVVQEEYEISGYKQDELAEKIKNRTLTEQELHRVAQDLYSARKGQYEDEKDAYDQVVKAYQDGSLSVQDALVLTGTTSSEASTTIEGAMNSAKGAWENFLVSLTDPEYDVGTAAQNLADTVGTAAGLIAPRVGTALGEVIKVIEEKGPEIVQKAKDAFLNAIPEEDRKKLEDDFNNFKDTLDGIAGAFKTIEDAIKLVTLPLQAVGEGLGYVAADIATTFDDTMLNTAELEAVNKQTADKMIKKWESYPDEIKQKFINADGTLTEEGQKIIDGLMGGAEEKWEEKKPWWESIADWIKAHKGPEEKDATLLTDSGKAIVDGFVSGATQSWEDKRTAFTEIGPWISNAFSNAQSWLHGAGSDIIGGLDKGVSGEWVNVKEFFGSVYGSILGNFDNAGRWLDDSGGDVIRGLLDGINDLSSRVFDWFAKLPREIVSSIGDVGNLLFDAGSSIMDGLLNGIRDAFTNVQDFVLGIGGWIADNKGPKAYDLQLLVPNGQWIMQSLETGMRKSFPLIEGVVSDIEGIMDINAPALAVSTSGYGYGLPPVNVYMTYNAGEDAKELVGDFVGQLRRYGYTMGGRG